MKKLLLIALTFIATSNCSQQKERGLWNFSNTSNRAESLSALSTELKNYASESAEFRPVSVSTQSPLSQSRVDSTRTTPSVADLMATGPSPLFMQQHQQSSSVLPSHVTTPVTVSPRAESVQPQASATCESLPPLATSLAQAAVTAQNKLHKCPQCEKTFNHTDYVKRHIKRIHSNQERHKCPQCEKSFKYAGYVKEHIKGAHQNQERHKCPQCEKSFSHAGNATAHIKRIHSNQERYKCPQCEKNISSKWNLKIHIETIHKGIKDHKCIICSKEFREKGHLKRHIKVVHDKIKNHQCPHCPHKSGQRSDLNNHIKNKHPEAQEAK
jgi:DNA-directed RNA polymerase subunit RPC12/RpoP